MIHKRFGACIELELVDLRVDFNCILVDFGFISSPIIDNCPMRPSAGCGRFSSDSVILCSFVPVFEGHLIRTISLQVKLINLLLTHYSYWMAWECDQIHPPFFCEILSIEIWNKIIKRSIVVVDSQFSD
jgi:hypothetical protein